MSNDPHSTLANILSFLKGNIMKKIVSVSEYIVTFNVKRFIKIFIYHLLFFYIGPLVVPLVIILDNKQFACNMAFWLPTHLMPSFIVQYLLWSMNVTMAIIYLESRF